MDYRQVQRLGAGMDARGPEGGGEGDEVAGSVEVEVREERWSAKEGSGGAEGRRGGG